MNFTFVIHLHFALKLILFSVPGPPGQLRAAAASPHQILVTWKPPSEPNGMITGYILHYRKSMDGSSSQHEFPLDSNISSQTLHGLEVGKEYEIWINAQTKIGTGFRSGIVKARTMTKSKYAVSSDSILRGGSWLMGLVNAMLLFISDIKCHFSGM